MQNIDNIPRHIELEPEVKAAVDKLQSRKVFRFLKRAFDIVFSMIVFVLFSWLFVLIAVAIKIDDPSGPILYKQTRVTRRPNGRLRTFNLWKFRSMYPGAERQLIDLKRLNEKSGPIFKIKDDPRVTRVGKLLRKMSLDELPQFINVFLGDISLVGPRPALPEEVASYKPHHMQRLAVKPGITCYWQTRANRDFIPFDMWVDLDILYIKKAGVWTDTKLIIQTVGVVLTAQGT